MFGAPSTYMRSIDPQLLATVMGGCKNKQPRQQQMAQAQPSQPQGQAQAQLLVQPQKRKMEADVQVAHGGAPQSMDGGDSATA